MPLEKWTTGLSVIKILRCDLYRRLFIIIIIILPVLILGCVRLWITDGIWKTVFPHCMFHVEVTCIFHYLCTSAD